MSKPGLPTPDDARQLIRHYHDHKRAGEDLTQRMKAVIRALELEDKYKLYGYGSVTILKQAVADFEITKKWPPVARKERAK